MAGRRIQWLRKYETFTVLVAKPEKDGQDHISYSGSGDVELEILSALF
jgi:hypothetical protein